MINLLDFVAIFAVFFGILGCIGMTLCLCSYYFDSKNSKKSEDNKK